MRIAKPVLKVSTPLGMIGGLIEGYRIAGGLVLLMALMMAVVGAGVAYVMSVIRKERAQSAAAARSSR